MPKDVIVVVNLDAKPNPSEALDILILSTAGAKDPAIYRSLEEVAATPRKPIGRSVPCLSRARPRSQTPSSARSKSPASRPPPGRTTERRRRPSSLPSRPSARPTTTGICCSPTKTETTTSKLLVSGRRARSRQRQSSARAKKTTANSTSARLTTSLWLSRTAGAPSSTPTPRTLMRRRTPPTSATSVPSTRRA